jgi:8-oxo-dGTP diphosphatase
MNKVEVQPEIALRCSVALWGPARKSLLLVRRAGVPPTFALPGGTPLPGEGLLACGRREVIEETGVQAMPTLCLLIAEALDGAGRLCLDVVLEAEPRPVNAEVVQQEDHLAPEWVEVDRLASIQLVPPIAGHLRWLARAAKPESIPLLGNLWRPHLDNTAGVSAESDPVPNWRDTGRR